MGEREGERGREREGTEGTEATDFNRSTGGTGVNREGLSGPRYAPKNARGVSNHQALLKYCRRL
jgi:hypothetical protein